MGVPTSTVMALMFKAPRRAPSFSSGEIWATADGVTLMKIPEQKPYKHVKAMTVAGLVAGSHMAKLIIPDRVVIGYSRLRRPMWSAAYPPLFVGCQKMLLQEYLKLETYHRRPKKLDALMSGRR